MLQITNGAAALLTEIRRTSDVPEDYGLRIFPETTADEGDVSVSLGFTDQPQEGDQVSEQQGLRVFVAPELTQPLDAAAIDVMQENGAERLVFRPQQENGSPAV